MPALDDPKLKRITLLRERVDNWDQYPFNIPIIRNFKELESVQKEIGQGMSFRKGTVSTVPSGL